MSKQNEEYVTMKFEQGVIKLLTNIRGRALLRIHIPSITLIKGFAVAKGLIQGHGKEKKGIWRSGERLSITLA